MENFAPRQITSHCQHILHNKDMFKDIDRAYMQISTFMQTIFPDTFKNTLLVSKKIYPKKWIRTLSALGVLLLLQARGAMRKGPLR